MLYQVLCLCLAAAAASAGALKSSDIVPFEDPFADGVNGQPGAFMHVSPRVYWLASTQGHPALLSYAKNNVHLENFNVTFDVGTFAVSNLRVSDLYFPYFSSEVQRSPAITWYTSNARLVAYGGWDFLPTDPEKPKATGGATLVAHSIRKNFTTEVQIKDGAPTVAVTDCAVEFRYLRFDLVGAIVPRGSDSVMDKVRQLITDELCRLSRDFVHEEVNAALATFPTKQTIFSGKDFELSSDYTMTSVKITEEDIVSHFKGAVTSHRPPNPPFHPPAVNIDVEGDRLRKTVRFYWTDYTFNTLFYHLHQHTQELKKGISSEQWIDEPAKNQWLSLSCGSHPTSQSSPGCIGAVFPNISSDGQAEVVFRTTTKAPAVIFNNGYGLFDASGMMEIYLNVAGKRVLFTQLDVTAIRGRFMPQLVMRDNITAELAINEMRLTPYVAPARALLRNINMEYLTKLSAVIIPVVEEMFNNLFVRYVQLPLPMIDIVECSTVPNMAVFDRVAMFECDLRVKTVYHRQLYG